MTKLADEVRVIDADTHMTEVHDLWTKRAPKGYEDRVPQVKVLDGRDMWIMDGKVLGPARGGGVIDREGKKFPHFLSQNVWGINEIHRAAYDPVVRMALMDECGVYAQVIYPNDVGIGGQRLANSTPDPKLRSMCTQIFNDSRAELQAESGDRLLPMPVMPAWSIEECVQEAERVAAMGMRGVNLMTDPQDAGSPDLADRAWDPFWALCADLGLPVHFHIGSSMTAMDFYGKYFWPSQHTHVKPAIGGGMLFIGNARLLFNTVYAGIFDRHPTLKMVSVESGVGWIPFILEAMDYEIWENAPERAAELNKNPSEYFATNWYATMWFEQNKGNLQGLLDSVGEDNVLFETDFPHPTCLYPDPLGSVEERFSSLRPETRRKVLGENAAKLYRV